MPVSWYTRRCTSPLLGQFQCTASVLIQLECQNLHDNPLRTLRTKRAHTQRMMRRCEKATYLLLLLLGCMPSRCSRVRTALPDLLFVGASCTFELSNSSCVLEVSFDWDCRASRAARRCSQLATSSRVRVILVAGRESILANERILYVDMIS